MPLLKPELDCFPSDLFELRETECPWWVAHVRSRQEKALARHLWPLEIPFYLPQIEQRTRRTGREFISYIPLFSGYLFFRGSLGDRQSALRSNLIVKVLDVADQGQLQRELKQLRALQESGASLVPYREIQVGDPVRIVEGPFKGYEGAVLRTQTRLRLVVSISMLRRSVAVEFDRDVLRSVRSSSRFREDARSAVA